MSLEQLARLTPAGSKFDFGGAGGGTPDITWENVAGALADDSLMIGHARASTASEFAWCFILKRDRLEAFKRKFLVDLGRYWVEKKLDHPREKYLLRMIDVACLDAMAGAGKKPKWTHFIHVFGCTKHEWYTKHRKVYMKHVYPFLNDYEGIVRMALARMNRD